MATDVTQQGLGRSRPEPSGFATIEPGAPPARRGPQRGLAPLDAVESVLRATFCGAREALRAVVAAGHPATELSMGMSNDYEIAVEEGATMVRLGTILFGARPVPVAGQAHD